MITQSFTGSKEVVDREIAAYFKQYHPAGYGTRVVHYVERPGEPVRAKVERSESCD